ncbi:MAG TPA: DUF935 family protein, partial [Polyangiaceae bacterium]|nr:DUF935 family protein [Polyangiaceae bacterium]
MRGRIRTLIEDAKRDAQRFTAVALSFADQLLRPAPPVLDEIATAESTSEILAPRDEVLLAHGAGDFAVYDRLKRHPQVYSTLHTRCAEVIAREYVVEPGADDEPSKQAADFLREELELFGFDQVTRKMLGGLIPGNAYGECMFKIDEVTGYVRLPEIKVRPANRFAFHRDGSLMIKRKGTPERAPDRKVWVYRATSENDDDPYGQGLGQILYWPVWFQNNGLRFWSVFLERFANPTPIAKVPPGTKDEDLNKLIALLGSIMNGGRIVVPRGVDVELIQAIRSSGGDFQVFCELLDAMISKVMLGQTMTTDQGSSYAQAS